MNLKQSLLSLPLGIQYFLLKFRWVDINKVGLLFQTLRLEASSKCQLLCPLCITGLGITRKKDTGAGQSVGWGNLTLDSFKKIIDSNPSIRAVELSNYGEIFLNSDLIGIMEYAFEKKIKLSALNGVNLNTLSDAQAEALAKYQFYKLKVSVDGASEESYQQYRVGGSYEKVIANIEKINYYKNLHRSAYPKLKWQFIVFGHNEHEITAAREKAKELGMGFKVKLNFRTKKFPIKNADFVRRESGLGVASLEEFETKHKKMYSPACLQLWTAPQVNWDGKLLGCCVNHFSDFGNVLEEGLENLLESEKYRYTKEMLMGRKPLREDLPCSQCKRMSFIQQFPVTETQLLAEFQKRRKKAKA